MLVQVDSYLWTKLWSWRRRRKGEEDRSCLISPPETPEKCAKPSVGFHQFPLLPEAQIH